MTHLPVSRELQPLTKSKSSSRSSHSPAWNSFVATINSSDFLVVAALCLLGLLLTLTFMFSHPEVGALIEQYNLF